MAKVTGPLYSISASGKIANAMVHFVWKGVHAVRQWVVPTNKMSLTQGDVRIEMGGTGRAVGKIQPSKTFAEELITLNLIPAGQTKQSFLVKYILVNYLSDATAYAAELALLTAHTAYSAFLALADNLTITEFDLPYAAIAPYNKALGLFLIAKTGIALGFTFTPFTLPLNSWVTVNVNAMGTSFTS